MVFEEKQAFLKATSKRLFNYHVDNINCIIQDPDGNFDVNDRREPSDSEKPLKFATLDDLEHFEPLDQTSREYLLAEKCILARLNEESKGRFNFRNDVKDAVEKLITLQIKKMKLLKGLVTFASFRNLAFSTRNKRTYPAVDYAIIFDDRLSSDKAQVLFQGITLDFYYKLCETVSDGTRYKNSNYRDIEIDENGVSTNKHPYDSIWRDPQKNDPNYPTVSQEDIRWISYNNIPDGVRCFYNEKPSIVELDETSSNSTSKREASASTSMFQTMVRLWPVHRRSALQFRTTFMDNLESKFEFLNKKEEKEAEEIVRKQEKSAQEQQQQAAAAATGDAASISNDGYEDDLLQPEAHVSDNDLDDDYEMAVNSNPSTTEPGAEKSSPSDKSRQMRPLTDSELKLKPFLRCCFYSNDEVDRESMWLKTLRPLAASKTPDNHEYILFIKTVRILKWLKEMYYEAGMQYLSDYLLEMAAFMAIFKKLDYKTGQLINSHLDFLKKEKFDEVDLDRNTSLYGAFLGAITILTGPKFFNFDPMLLLEDPCQYRNIQSLSKQIEPDNLESKDQNEKGLHVSPSSNIKTAIKGPKEEIIDSKPKIIKCRPLFYESITYCTDNCYELLLEKEEIAPTYNEEDQIYPFIAGLMGVEFLRTLTTLLDMTEIIKTRRDEYNDHLERCADYEPSKLIFGKFSDPIAVVEVDPQETGQAKKSAATGLESEFIYPQLNSVDETSYPFIFRSKHMTINLARSDCNTTALYRWLVGNSLNEIEKKNGVLTDARSNLTIDNDVNLDVHFGHWFMKQIDLRRKAMMTVRQFRENVDSQSGAKAKKEGRVANLVLPKEEGEH